MHAIKKVAIFYLVCFLIQNPLAMDLVLNLPNDGIRLVFDPVTQRLKVILIVIFLLLFLFLFFFFHLMLYFLIKVLSNP